MFKKILTYLLFGVFSSGYSQNFTHSGYLYNADASGAENVPLILYRRTTSSISGFTSQTNWNGHSYYRSTSSSTWTNAKTACENMGGHLATVSSSAENNFLFNTWPSGWIGLYQDKSAAFYSEPNGGWRWTENEVEDYKHNFDSKNYTSSKPLPDDVDNKDATLYNGPTYQSSGGKYLYFDGSNDYAITGNLAGSFNNGSKITTLQLLCYPQDPGVLVSEFGAGNASSGWHESVMEITSNGTLRVGFWNGTAITSISTSITMNAWNLITMTYDGSTMKGYLNGILFGTTTFNRDVPHAYSGNGLYYCFGKEDATNMGNGTYAQFRFGSFQVYNRALSDDEVMRNWMHISYRYGRIPYTNWNSGEPNNSGGEDYAQFVTSGRWNDLSNTSLPYVIEFDYIVTNSSWAPYDTFYTNSSGYFSINITSDPSKQYYIVINSPVVSQALTYDDAKDLSDIILGKSSKNGLKFHMFDLNDDNKITISDKYYLLARKSGIFSNWSSSVPDTRIFTSSEYNALKNGTTNMRSLYPGVSQIITSTLTSGGSLTYYIIAPGYSGKVKY
jgi:hypothetical protein